MPCPVGPWERPLRSHIFELHVYERHYLGSTLSEPHPLSLTLTLPSLELLSLTFPNLTFTFPSLVFTFPSLALTYSSLILSSLTLSALYTSSTLIPLHQILVCETFVQSHQFWDTFRSDLVCGSTKTMLVAWSWAAELQEENNQSQIIRTEHPGLEGWEDFDGVPHYEKLPYAPEIIKAELTIWVTATRHQGLRQRIVTFTSCQKSGQKPCGNLKLLPAPTCR